MVCVQCVYFCWVVLMQGVWLVYYNGQCDVVFEDCGVGGIMQFGYQEIVDLQVVED